MQRLQQNHRLWSSHKRFYQMLKQFRKRLEEDGRTGNCQKRIKQTYLLLPDCGMNNRTSWVNRAFYFVAYQQVFFSGYYRLPDAQALSAAAKGLWYWQCKAQAQQKLLPQGNPFSEVINHHQNICQAVLLQVTYCTSIMLWTWSWSVVFWIAARCPYIGSSAESIYNTF